ncbi:flagellar biosynthetic protein FliO [Stenotrophomonas rhizophila]|uniref:flagellar biosynthetic protein FliO n=1 Tax=Stenotrophomonas rhizophila TaxID=216778 RepID=UPI0037198AE5
MASLLIAAGTPAAKVGQHAAAAPSMFGAVLALLAVLALIIGLGWLLKRMPGSGFRPAEGMRVVASLNVGAKERVVVVEVNGEQLLLGVTAGGINTLHRLPEPLPTPAPARLPDLKNLPTLKNLPNFAQLLQQRLRKEP